MEPALDIGNIYYIERIPIIHHTIRMELDMLTNSQQGQQPETMRAWTTTTEVKRNSVW
jgi:hypothetical protein